MNRGMRPAMAFAFSVLSGGILSAGGPAGEGPGPGELKPFSMPPDDSSPGPADVSFLLEAPAGSRGFVEARDGHFFAGGRRIRFFGVNLCFAACFPSREEAPRIAARLAKSGVNCVRFHHMDSSPFPRGIFKDRSLQELSPDALDRLDSFIAELARRGIYSDLNLHVSRCITRALDWPHAKELESFDKMVDLFHPELVALQKRYARDLLAHKNPHTGRRYLEEPAVAMVEITNEDSLFMWGSMGSLARLPEPYEGVIRGQWNEWLLRRHGTDDRLRAAWAPGEEPLGEERIRDGDFHTVAARGKEKPEWVFEEHEGSDADSFETAGPDRKRAIRIEVPRSTGTSWHVQFKQIRLPVRKGRFYTVRFQARADREKTIGLAVGQDGSPWGNLGLVESVRLRPAWKAYRFGFTATGDEAETRLSFSLGGDSTAVEISGVSFRPGGRLGLAAEESLARKDVDLFPEGDTITAARGDDRLRFLRDAERSYFTDLRRYLKEELGLHAQVTGTIAFGSLGTEVEAEMDFVDQHAYWQHPQFPRRSWDPRDWTIPNVPMSASAEGGTLPGLASTRVLGKPYTVTEYNHPAPLDSQAETVPMIASFSAWQDWDGVFLFAYNHSGDFGRDRIEGFFDIDSNPAKMGFLGAGALIFSGEGLAPAPVLVSRRLSEEDAIQAARLNPTHLAPFLREDGFGLETLLASRWAISFGERGSAPAEAPSPGPGVLKWIREKGRERYIADGPAVKVICGRTEGRIDLEGVSIEVSRPASATLVLVAKDRSPIGKARSLLLVACGRCENSGMEWNADRSSVADRWGTAPSRIEPVRARIRIAGDPVGKVHSLDGRGQEEAEVKVEEGGGASSFTIGEGPPTLWYEVRR